MSRSLFLAATLLLPPVLAAQATWIVDSAGGPGVHFATIQAAVDAATNGDLIVVRGSPTPYAPAIVMKGLRIVGQQKAALRPMLGAGGMEFSVRYLSAGQPCTIADFAVAAGARLSIRSCAAPVVLDTIGTVGGGISAWVYQASAVMARNSVFEPLGGIPLLASQATMVLSSCTITGRDASLRAGGSGSLPGLQAATASITLVDCTVTGGRGAGTVFSPSAALVLASAEATVTGATRLVGGGAVAVLSSGASSSRLALDPRANIVGSISSGVVLVVRRVPNLGLRIGTSSIGIDVAQAPPGGPVAFVLGVPGPPVAIGIGTLWLDPSSLIELGVLGANSQGIASLNLTVPSLPSAFGYRFGVQAAAVDPIAATIELSNPSAAIVR